MKTYEEIQNEILRRGFEVIFVDFINDSYGITPFLISQGIKILIEEYDDEFMEYFEVAVDKFINDDFGNLFSNTRDGYEYGHYESPLGNMPNTGAIMIHRENDYLFNKHIVMYLQFER